MDSQQEKNTPPPDRPSFLGLPPSWNTWSRAAGPTFWGGVLVGLGIGLLVAAILVQLELRRTAWVSVMGIVLAAIGQVIAWRAVRSRQP